MSLRFIDSFDHYSTNDLLGIGNGQKWNITNGVGSGSQNLPNYIISAGTGRFANSFRYVSAGNGSNYKHFAKVLDNQATWIVGFAFKYSNPPTISQIIMSLADSSSRQVELNLNVNGTLQVTRGGTAVTGGLSTNILNLNVWYYIEMLCTISASISSNQWQVNVNSANWINVASGQSSKFSSNSTANTICLLDEQMNLPTTIIDFDDLYICDGQGSTNNTFLGDVRVEARLPSANGTNTAWTANGAAAGFSCVDDPIPNGDNNFISSNTTNQISTFTFNNLSTTPLTIFGVQNLNCSRKTDAGGRNIADATVSGGTTSIGSNIALPNSYTYNPRILELDPATSAAWLAAAVNAMEVGVKEIS
jgi:hypothetical protein